MNFIKRFFTPVAVGILLIFLGLYWGCEDVSSSNKALINVLLIDAPGDFDEVWVEVLGVELLAAGSRGMENGDWVYIPYTSAEKVIRLTDLVGGQRLLLGRKEVPAGAVSQVKLVLGETHYFIKNGQQFPLQLVGNPEDLLTEDLKANAATGIALDIYIDFNVAASIQPLENGQFQLKPAIRVFTLEGTTEVRGIIRPPTSKPYVYAIHEADTFATLTSVSGEFRLRGLPPTPYRILIRPRPTHKDSVLQVVTKRDSVVNLGNITLKPITTD